MSKRRIPTRALIRRPGHPGTMQRVRPNTEDLGLSAAGIEVDARGAVVVDEDLRTATPGCGPPVM
jgi:hypothetical protein